MFAANYPIWFYAIGLWSIIWKGLALWRAAQNDQKIWFVVLLVLNTVGVLEIIYLFKFAKKPLTIKEMKTWPDTFNRSRKA